MSLFQLLISTLFRPASFTLLPELSTDGLNKEQMKRVKSLGPIPPSRQIGIVYHPAYSRPALLKQMSAAILEKLPEKVRENKSRYSVPWKKL